MAVTIGDVDVTAIMLTLDLNKYDLTKESFTDEALKTDHKALLRSMRMMVENKDAFPEALHARIDSMEKGLQQLDAMPEIRDMLLDSGLLDQILAAPQTNETTGKWQKAAAKSAELADAVKQGADPSDALIDMHEHVKDLPGGKHAMGLARRAANQGNTGTPGGLL